MPETEIPKPPQEESRFTIERVVPGVSPPELVSEHVARYRFASSLVATRRVLDLGCGAGYGAEILSRAGASTVVALDLAPEAAVLTRQVRSIGRVRPVLGAGDRLPIADGAIDCVVAFEVIEHIEDWDRAFSEIQRVLRSDGILILSTPNRTTYNEGQAARPNPYHVHEFDRQELADLLASRFPRAVIYDQVFAEGILIQTAEQEQLGMEPKVVRWDRIQPPVDKEPEPDYFIAVCWMHPGRRLTGLFRKRRSERAPSRESPPSVFSLSPTDFLRRLRTELRRRKVDLDEKRAWALKLDRELRAREAELLDLHEDLSSKVQWARGLEAEAEQRGERIIALQEELNEKDRLARALDSERRQLAATVLQLQQEIERLRSDYSIGSPGASKDER